MAKNTADDWKDIGSTEPWYGVLSAPAFLKKNLTEQAKENFFRQGRDEIAWAVSHIKTLRPDFQPQRALDFGCGIGRLSFAMRDYCPDVTGCDISPGMLAEAMKQRELRGAGGVHFVEGFPSGQKFDWINTYIVLQHILPRDGYHSIAEMLASLNPGGGTSIQLTFAHDQRDTTTLVRDVFAYRYDGETSTVLEAKDHQPGSMSMYDYDMNRILFMFTRAGIGTMKLVHTDHGGVHGFWIFGRKDG